MHSTVDDRPQETTPLAERVPSAAFAFRGYNVTNLGRTPELLAHPAYSAVTGAWLAEAGQICSELLHAPVDLVARVREKRESTLDTFGEDIGLILAVELAHIELLRDQFGIDYWSAKVGIGYSLGEIAALVASGVFSLEDVLHPLVSLAPECVELARDVSMGIVFSRGPALAFDTIERLCLEITLECEGAIGISSQLSPNTVLTLGQGTTVDRLQKRVREEFGNLVHVKKRADRWPPLHTHLLWQKQITDRAAMIMLQIDGGFTVPVPPVISLVTGKASYTALNSRSLLRRWIDHPQKLWDGLCETLASGADIFFHVGPEPNLLPATFKRLSDNITSQVTRWSVGGLGMRAMTGLVRRPWLTKVLSSKTHLLRIPFIAHINVEDWLLEQKPQ